MQTVLEVEPCSRHASLQTALAAVAARALKALLSDSGKQDTLRCMRIKLLMGGRRRSPGSRRLRRQPAMTRTTSCMRICQLPGSTQQVSRPAAPCTRE